MSAINRGRKKAIPGIYTRLKKKELEARPMPILTHGSRNELSHELHITTERIQNPRL